jgi:hypothetical protein
MIDIPWKMNAEDAAQRGALRPDLQSREVRMQPETEAEVRQLVSLHATTKPNRK